MTERVAHIKCLIPQWLEVKKIKYTLENIKKKKKVYSLHNFYTLTYNLKWYLL